MSMIYVTVGDKHYRTKSFDTVARRLYGPKARVVIEEGNNGRVVGTFVTPDRSNPAILRIRGHFIEDKKDKGDERASRIVKDDEGHSARRYR